MTPRNPGNLEVRLARSGLDIDAAQALRYDVFYNEMGAQPDVLAARERRDRDQYDSLCDHLLVIDHDRTDNRGVVGTYRLMNRAMAMQSGGFYTADEFDLSALLQWPGEILELGRSCVHPDYRRGGIMQLLLRGIADYARQNCVDILFGCGSFHGSDPEAMSLGLSYLHHYHQAPWTLCPRAQPGRHVAMDLMAPDVINERAAQKSLPPLIKGYLRLGGCVGDGAVVDHQFNTVDVCIVVRVDQVTERYSRRYKPQASPTNYQQPAMPMAMYAASAD